MGNQKEDLNQTSLLVFLYGWRKPILIITGIGLITSIIVSLTLPVYYKAVAVVFPRATHTTEYNTENRGAIGDEEDAEQLMLILQSPEIRDSLTVRHNLYKHYDIDPKEDHARSDFQETYEENVSFERTRENAIEIVVLDEDPEVAMEMANDIVRLADTAFNRMIRTLYVDAMYSVQDEVALIKQELGDYQDKMKVYRDSGVADKDERQNLYSSYVEAVKLGNENLAAELNRKIKATEKFGSDYDLNMELATAFSVRYAEMLDVNDQARERAKTYIPQSLPRNLAEEPDKKYLPKRMIIVALSTLGAFLFSCVLIIAWVRFKELKANA